MTEKPTPAGAYGTAAGLLARKGAAEPLLRNEARLELVSDAGADRSDEARLADSVVRATANRLTGKRGRGPAAALTDLLDESLIGIVSPHSGQVGRTVPARVAFAPERGKARTSLQVSPEKTRSKD